MNQITDYEDRAESLIPEQLKRRYGGPVRPIVPPGPSDYTDFVLVDDSTGDELVVDSTGETLVAD